MAAPGRVGVGSRLPPSRRRRHRYVKILCRIVLRGRYGFYRRNAVAVSASEGIVRRRRCCHVSTQNTNDATLLQAMHLVLELIGSVRLSRLYFTTGVARRISVK